MNFTKSYKSGTIFLSIIIALIVGIFSSSLIILVYYYRTSTNKLLIEKKLNNNIASSLVLLLDSNSAFIDSTTNLDLLENQTDSVYFKKSDWGLFTNYEIMATYNKFKKKIIVQTGIKQEIPQYAIYLYSNSRPLTLLGNTVVKGVCYLTDAGIKTSYFDGKAFSGSIPNEKELKLNDTFHPTFSNILKEKINHIIKQTTITSSIDKSTVKKYDNSFYNDLVSIHSSKRIILNEDTIKGNYIIKSDQSIEIAKNSYLEDVIIIAPVIKINANCSGNLQIFATDSILISNDCTFEYPTVLYIDSKNDNKTLINIANNTKITGYVILLNNSTDPYKFSSINIEKKAKITGLIYTDKFVDIKGSVLGSITCDKFILRTTSSVYDNYVLNAEINGVDLPRYFVNAGVFNTKNKSEKAIVKYVN